MALRRRLVVTGLIVSHRAGFCCLALGGFGARAAAGELRLFAAELHLGCVWLCDVAIYL